MKKNIVFLPLLLLMVGSVQSVPRTNKVMSGNKKATVLQRENEATGVIQTKEIPLIGYAEDGVVVDNNYGNVGIDYLTPLDELKMIAGSTTPYEGSSVGDLLDQLYLTADDLAFLQVEDDKKKEAAVSEIAQELLSLYYLAQAQSNQAFIAAMQAWLPTAQIFPLPIDDVQILPLAIGYSQQSSGGNSYDDAQILPLPIEESD
jgi:hypothetical protein